MSEIESRFTYYAPNGNKPEKYVSIRSEAKNLAIKICQYVPESREQSIAITKLEEVVMWANAGIARYEEMK